MLQSWKTSKLTRTTFIRGFNFLGDSQWTYRSFYSADAPKCPAELLEGVSWAATAATGTDIQPCPKGASGKSAKGMRCEGHDA